MTNYRQFEVKPCPCCSSTNVDAIIYYEQQVRPNSKVCHEVCQHVICNNCGLQIEHPEAGARWNNRPIDVKVIHGLATAKVALEDCVVTETVNWPDQKRVQEARHRFGAAGKDQYLIDANQRADEAVNALLRSNELLKIK